MGSTFKQICLVGMGVVAGVGLTMQFSALSIKPPVEASMPIPELRQVAAAYEVIRESYVDPVDGRPLLPQAISGMVASLDPHSAYLDPRAYRELREGTEGRFVGVGIEIVPNEAGLIEIVAPMEDSPAWHAGIEPGDVITHIDRQPVQGEALDESIKRMRGEPGTRVLLTVVRKTLPEPLEVSIMRSEIVQKSVKAKMVAPGYAWVRIAQFQEPTVDDLAARLQQLYREDQELKGLILDLRNDPGGLLQGAIGVAAAFLPKDAEIVSTNGQLEQSRQRFYARPEFYMLRTGADPLAQLPPALKKVPMVVLVNTGSASASEIVAGALQDYKRATILGSRTFGKGSVQTVRPIGRDAAVKLTTARYYTPLGRSIQARGIIPDLAVDENEHDDGLNALRMREADLQRHLANGSDAEYATSEEELALQEALLESAWQRQPIDYGSKNDFQLAQALRHLEGQPVQLSRRASATTLARGTP